MFFSANQDSSLSECDFSIALKPEPNAASLTCFTDLRDSPSLSASEKESECLTISDRDILEQQIIETNSELLKRGVRQYIGCCLNQPFYSSQSISNGRTFYFQKTPEAGEEDKTLVTLILSNSLLTSFKKRYLRTLYKQLEELRDVFQEINRNFCEKISQELVLVIQAILENKMKEYKQCLNNYNSDYLPKMNRIVGQEGLEIIFHGGWEVYNDVDEEIIKKFAGQNTNKIAKELYFSEKIKELTFRNVSTSEVSLEKFSSLISFLSENLFMSLSGICQPQQSMFEYIYDLYSNQDENRGDRLFKKVKKQ